MVTMELERRNFEMSIAVARKRSINALSVSSLALSIPFFPFFFLFFSFLPYSVSATALSNYPYSIHRCEMPFSLRFSSHAHTDGVVVIRFSIVHPHSNQHPLRFTFVTHISPRLIPLHILVTFPRQPFGTKFLTSR